MNRLNKNSISNIFAKLWSFVSLYLFVPFYIKILGEESYGIVSFFATMQTAINLLGLGLSNTLMREFAVQDTDKEKENIRKRKLLHGIEFVYGVIAIVVSIGCFAFSYLIARYWLNIGALEYKYVANVIMLMGVSISLQIVANLYSGGVFGLEKQIVANILLILWSVLKSVGSLLIIKFVKPDLQLFYAWHILIDVLYLCVLRFYLHSQLRTKSKVPWRFQDIVVIKDIWKYAVGILIISLVAFLNKQLDKIVISKVFTLTELGAYNLATTLGSTTTIFSTALYTSVFPSFVSDISAQREQEENEENLPGQSNKVSKAVQDKFISTNRIVNLVTIFIGSFVAIFSVPLIQFWVRTSTYNDMLKIAAPLVVMAVTFSELQQIPYALVLAIGNTRINVMLGILYLPIVLALTILGTYFFGLIGAGIVYIVVMSSQTFIYEYIIMRKYLSVNPLKTIFIDTIIPVLLGIGAALFSRYIVACITSVNSVTVLLAVLSGALSLGSALLIVYRTKIKTRLHTKMHS